MSDLQLRHLTAADADPIADAFARIGWTKPAEQYLRYAAEAEAGDRVCLIAECDDQLAGYGTLLWSSAYPPFRNSGVPEIADLNVFPQHQRGGVGAALMQALEDTARQRSPTVGLGVGLHSGYGAAQRLYVARGYRPDGRGVVYDNEVVEQDASIPIDDSASLMFTLSLSSSPGASR